MKTIIHVNQHVIKSNAKTGAKAPVLTVKTHKSNTYASTVQINGPSKVVYSPHKPLSCGARVWIETEAQVLIDEECAVKLNPNPTAEDIEAARTPKGGWTRKQLAEWGIPWPPPRGWKKALEEKK